MGKSRPIQDPRAFLHFIPWEELLRTSGAFLRSRGVDLADPFSDFSSTSNLFLWTPPFPGFVWNHHLHTEEEVFSYNTQQNWQFPGHGIDGDVIFVACPVNQTNFIGELGKFWDKWVRMFNPWTRYHVGLTHTNRTTVRSHKNRLPVH